MYQVRRLSRSAFVPIRGLSYHLREWGNPDAAPPLVLLHGWMDVSASFQFVVDAFSEAFCQGRRVLAPDWRGFGRTGSPPGGDHYAFPEYLADLDALLDQVAPDGPVDLVGHSMGGNVAMLYAGVRPARIRRLINLEGFGMPATEPAQAPQRYADWLDALQALRAGALALKPYKDLAGVARRLMRTNARLDPDRALWLAAHWAREEAPGRWTVLGDAAHKVPSAQLYRLDEALEVFRRIAAPTLVVQAADDSLARWYGGRYTRTDFQARMAVVPRLAQARVADAGHMLHHDQPQALAALIEEFLTR